jgi:hypothetical protein
MGAAAAFIPLIVDVAGKTLPLIFGSGGPKYPSPPKINKLDVQGTKQFMQEYEARRMQTSIDEWGKKRFPLLYKGGQYEINDLIGNQKGALSPSVAASIKAVGLQAPKEGDQYKTAVDLGLSPIALSQRTSQAVTRNIAMNPEWTNKISGGTLASMIANNYQNQQAFTQFLGANATAQYVAGQARGTANTQALIAGIGGAASIGMNPYAPWNSRGQSPSLTQPVGYPSVFQPQYNYNQPTQSSYGQQAATFNPYGNSPFLGVPEPNNYVMPEYNPYIQANPPPPEYNYPYGNY